MPYGFSFHSSGHTRKQPEVGRPKRDRGKVKASRRANRTRRR